ncbi:MAG: cytochrome P450 [Actinomycetota bacterium]|nr:cytochrome P450 [Actinomycetota bacterium]
MTLIDPKSLPFTDLTERVMFDDPFPRWAELRANAPVSFGRTRETRTIDCFLLSRYEDVQFLHSDPRFSSDPTGGEGEPLMMRFLPKTFRILTDSMVFKDDPEHKRLRGLVNKAFTPKRVAQMADDVTAVVDRLVDELAAKRTVEFVEDFAVPLPLAVIAEMLGVRPAEREEFKQAIEVMTDSNSGGAVRQIPKALASGRRIRKMLEGLAHDRRANPIDDLITALVSAREGTEELADNEVVSMLFLLLLAGHDTTANLLTGSMLAFIEHPEQVERLRAEPELIDTAVEELLRYTTPVPCGAVRTLTDDVEIAGSTLPKGSKVLGMIIGANRDESVFDRPEELDLGREPNRHLAFAFGSHFCLGNQLARLEARIALTALVQRFDEISLAVDRSSLRFKPTVSLRGLAALPLHLGSRS